MRTRRAKWERRSCVAEVFGPCLGVLGRHQVYVRIIRSNIDNPPDEEEKEWGLRTDFVEHKNETLALRFAPAYLFLYQSTTAPSWVTGIEHEEDDVGLVDDFVQHADVVSPL